MLYVASAVPAIFGFAIGTIGWIAIGVVFLAVVLAVVVAVTRPGQGAAREQRPFHICPECSAYNAKPERVCWRCNHDMTKGAIAANGDLGVRLEQLDSARNPQS